MTNLSYCELPSPLGGLLLVFRQECVYVLDYVDYRNRMMQLLEHRFGEVSLVPASCPSQISQALDAYFAGHLDELDALSVNPGGTTFQQKVWTALRLIPPGETISYGEIAASLGSPRAARAVGLANSLNPIAIIIPCHRVVGASGKLTGYAGGIDRKLWLIEHERFSLMRQPE